MCPSLGWLSFFVGLTKMHLYDFSFYIIALVRMPVRIHFYMSKVFNVLVYSGGFKAQSATV